MLHNATVYGKTRIKRYCRYGYINGYRTNLDRLSCFIPIVSCYLWFRQDLCLHNALPTFMLCGNCILRRKFLQSTLSLYFESRMYRYNSRDSTSFSFPFILMYSMRFPRFAPGTYVLQWDAGNFLHLPRD